MSSSILPTSESFVFLFEVPDSLILQLALLFCVVSLLGEVDGPGGDVGRCDCDWDRFGDGEGLVSGGVGDREGALVVVVDTDFGLVWGVVELDVPVVVETVVGPH